MKAGRGLFVLLMLVMANTTTPCLLYAAESKDFVQPPVTVAARDILPQDQRQGENFKVEDKVSNDGLINTYQLSTDYGPLTVESTAELLIRINELRALTIMEEMDRKKVFGDALVSGVKGTVKGAGEFVKSPIETSKSIVRGTGRFLSNLSDSIFSNDPDQDNVLKVALGYDTAKRQFAFELGIDPYTGYEPVVNRLGEIAQAAVAGGLTPRAAMAAVDHTVVLAMQISGTAYGMMQLVRDNPPVKLREINEDKLKAMGLDESLIEAFLDNYRYTPQEKTILVGELESMKGVKGFDVFVSQAVVATEPTTALYYRVRAQMMAGYHANVSPVEDIRNIDGLLVLQRKDGVLVLLAPVDYIFWTKRLEDRLDGFENTISKMKDISGKEFWITGRFDNAVKAHFESRGWKVSENANQILLKKN